MKIRFQTLLLLLGISVYASAVETGPMGPDYTGRVNDPAQVCMNKRTVQSRTSYTYDYEGKTYHFCCTMCLTKFKGDPEHEKIAADPVNGESVDKATALIYSYKGRAYFFSSEKTLKKFSKKPTKYLAKEKQTS